MSTLPGNKFDIVEKRQGVSGDIVDKSETNYVMFYSPSISVTQNGTCFVTYTRETPKSDLDVDEWPRDIHCSVRYPGDPWKQPFQLTNSVTKLLDGQCWANLYWDSKLPPKNDFLAVWDGKKEGEKFPSGDWYARSFKALEFVSA